MRSTSRGAGALPSSTCSIASLTSSRLRSSYSRRVSGRGGAARRPPRGRGACRRSSRGCRGRRGRSRRSGARCGCRPAGRRRPACRRARASRTPARTRFGLDGGGDRRVGAAEAWIAATGSCSSGLTRCSAPSSRGALEPRLVDVDGDHRRAGDARVLDGEVAEAAGAEHGDEARRARAGVLDRLVGGHAGAGQRRGVGGSIPSGTRTTWRA